MKEVRFGIAGLGRLGKVHAGNIASRIPGAKLVAACSIVEAELEYAREKLGITKTYTDFREMVKDPDLDAVAIVTTSSEHCWQIEAALDAGKHVFCDKPLGVTLEECEIARAAVERHPELTFMLGFMRRFDPSYAYAKRKIESGAIGTPYMVKATGIDPEATVEGSIRFARTSGGIFVDMAVHDIDLMRWFLNDEPETVYAIGSSYGFPQFAELGDAEAGCALFHFKKGGMGIVHTGRTAAHGYHIETEIVGTKGSIRISPIPEKNLALLYNEHGVVTECVEGFPERFAEAYLAEVAEFVDCVRTGRKSDVKVTDGTASTKIAFAATESFKTGKLVEIK